MLQVLHNYWKIAWFEGRHDELSNTLWPLLVSELRDTLGETENSTKLKMIGDTYHVVGCNSPEYNCYPPFENRMCHTEQVRKHVLSTCTACTVCLCLHSPSKKLLHHLACSVVVACRPIFTIQDCNYEIAQLRWGLKTVLDMMKTDPTLSQQPCDGRTPCSAEPRPCSNASRTWCPSDPAPEQCDRPTPSPCPPCPSKKANPCKVDIDFGWWRKLNDGALAWYPYDDVTGFRLDVNCAFECPHRHFSHLLQM